MDDLGLPSDAELERALFRYLAARRPVEPASVYGPLADQFALTVTQRTVPLEDNSTPEWSNRVQAAQASLRQKGLLLETLTVWGLSEYGMKVAQSRTV
ncbi:hypothetical protein sos41_01010 [Alphaproteobacteria bacterium SO-S41]|nr:hypothetical protein sos41_01010 [Alphaproteobacteria bacterium SO-S41]